MLRTGGLAVELDFQLRVHRVGELRPACQHLERDRERDRPNHPGQNGEGGQRQAQREGEDQADDRNGVRRDC